MLIRNSGPHIQGLHDRIAELEEEMRQLRQVLSPPGLVEGFRAIGVTRIQAAILAALLGRGPLSRDQLMMVMYPDADQRYERSIKIVDQHMSLLRRRMRPFGLTVSNTWGVGYYLNDEAKAGLRALVGRQFLKQAAE